MFQGAQDQAGTLGGVALTDVLQALVVLGLMLSIFGLLAGWTYRKVTCDMLAYKLTPAAEKARRGVTRG